MFEQVGQVEQVEQAEQVEQVEQDGQDGQVGQDIWTKQKGLGRLKVDAIESVR